jgi:hypothetical protein
MNSVFDKKYEELFQRTSQDEELSKTLGSPLAYYSSRSEKIYNDKIKQAKFTNWNTIEAN